MWPPCPAGNGTSSFPTSPSRQAEPALSPGGHSPSPQSPKQQARASTPEITHISPATFPTHPCHVQWESLCQPAVRFDHHYYDIKHISHMRAHAAAPRQMWSKPIISPLYSVLCLTQVPISVLSPLASKLPTCTSGITCFPSVFLNTVSQAVHSES